MGLPEWCQNLLFRSLCLRIKRSLLRPIRSRFFIEQPSLVHPFRCTERRRPGAKTWVPASTLKTEAAETDVAQFGTRSTTLHGATHTRSSKCLVSCFCLSLIILTFCFLCTYDFINASVDVVHAEFLSNNKSRISAKDARPPRSQQPWLCTFSIARQFRSL